MKKPYLIDVHLLRSAAFTTTTANSVSLRTILESPKIPKVFFDIRKDSDALFSHYQNCVDGIKDLQLMGTCKSTYLASLGGRAG
jgi:exonuclease 3'-5' domain-containing protein 1